VRLQLPCDVDVLAGWPGLPASTCGATPLLSSPPVLGAHCSLPSCQDAEYQAAVAADQKRAAARAAAKAEKKKKEEEKRALAKK
jgi:hypothetical protein